MTLQQRVYAEIDSERALVCVLCATGIPRGGQGLEHHHTVARSALRGERNLELLWNKVNIVLICQPHHAFAGHVPFRGLVALANIKLKYAKREDYLAYPITEEEWKLGTVLLGLCVGERDYGDAILDSYHGTPLYDTITLVWLGRTDRRIDTFCQGMCLHQNACIEQYRTNLMREIN